jgi:hypothetical protein
MFSVPGMLSSFSTVQDKHIDKTSSDKNIQIWGGISWEYGSQHYISQQS